MSSLKVAIIGAGPAGCTLAILLQHNPKIQVTIFEAEESVDARGQGGTLDLHDKTGLAAITRAGLLEKFQAKARYDAEALVIADKMLKRYINIGGTTKETSRGRPEIDREDLRYLLLEKIPKNTIKWNHKVRSISEDNTITFDNHIETGFDLVVGADGGWSKVRPLLTPVTPAYAGICMTRLRIKNAQVEAPEIYKLVNHGSFFSASDGKWLVGQQLGDGSIQVALGATRPENWVKTTTIDIHNAKALKAFHLEECADWSPQHRAMIAATDDDSEPWIRNLYHLPVGHRWRSKGHVTLIGDAAHIFTPFAGEGVNLAMEDAMKLADAILKTASTGSSSLAGNIKTFEEDMFVRAARTADTTFKMMSYMFFTDGSPDSIIEEYLCTALSDNVPWFVMPFARAAVYAYFWYWRRWGSGAASLPVDALPVELKQD